MSVVIRVEYHDYDQDTSTEIYGPFTKEGSAREFLKKLGYALRTEVEPGHNFLHYTEGTDGSVMISIQDVLPPRVRPVAAAVKDFMHGLVEGEGDPA